MARSAHDFLKRVHARLARVALLIRQGVAVLGRRYYLAAIVFSLIVVILVFAAG
jgi:multicomponent Na+:H+ antiporter subunit A